MVAAAWPWTLSVQAATKAERALAAANIVVEETLQREAAEGVDNRWQLLKPAILQAPHCEAAYWLSGFVYDAKRKDWLRWDEVQQLAAKDDRLAAYRQTREKYPETMDGQIRLARWCSKHKLEDQARAHLTRVLEFDPNHAEARQQLGFRSVNGTWVNDRDLAEAGTSARKASTAAAKWVPRLEKLRDRLGGGNAGQREKARRDLLALRDPDAVEAINTVFCQETSETALLGITLLQNIPSPRAAAVLAWHAVFSPWPQVAQAAATALQSQEKHDYVPLLLDAAETPTEPQTQVAGNSGSSSGSSSPDVRMLYRLDHSVSTYSFNTIQRLNEHPYWWQVPQMRYNPVSPYPVAKTTNNAVTQPGARYTTQQRQYYTVQNGRVQDRVTENNVTVDRQTLTPVGPYAYPRNSPAVPSGQPPGASSYGSGAMARQAAPCSALKEATGEKGPGSPSEWWDWWYDYNEVYFPSGKPSKAPDLLSSKAPASAATPAQRGDCLAAGTLVCTETGLMAVEQVAVGDRVFCCDPETGCLALKPILGKTVRPEGRLLKIRAGGEEFQASGGHVFWVAGRGWVKARDLREGMQLHTLRGTVPVEGVEPGALQTTIGLVTADFHTFFAGQGMVLTHDNTIRRPTNRIVPGLAAKAAGPVDL
jgi:hypothetical protein